MGPCDLHRPLQRRGLLLLALGPGPHGCEPGRGVPGAGPRHGRPDRRADGPPMATPAARRLARDGRRGTGAGDVARAEVSGGVGSGGFIRRPQR